MPIVSALLLGSVIRILLIGLEVSPSGKHSTHTSMVLRAQQMGTDPNVSENLTWEPSKLSGRSNRHSSRGIISSLTSALYSGDGLPT